MSTSPIDGKGSELKKFSNPDDKEVSRLLKSASTSSLSTSGETDRELDTPSPKSLSLSSSYESIKSSEGKHPRVKWSEFIPIQREQLKKHGVKNDEALILAGQLGISGKNGKVYYKISPEKNKREELGTGTSGVVTDAFLVKDNSVKSIAVKRIPGHKSQEEAQFLRDYPEIFPKLEFLIEKPSNKDKEHGKSLIGMEKGSSIVGDDKKSLSLEYIPKLIELLINSKNKGVINWDIRPANLMSFEGNLKFIDAGIVDTVKEDIPFDNLSPGGTPGYLYTNPKSKGKDATFSINEIYSFVFSLILFESLCGKVPGYFKFDENNPAIIDLLSSIKGASNPTEGSLIFITQAASGKFMKTRQSNNPTMNVIKSILSGDLTNLEEIQKHTKKGGVLSVDSLKRLKRELKIYKKTKLEVKFKELKKKIEKNKADNSVLLEIKDTFFSDDQKSKLLQSALKVKQEKIVKDEIIDTNLHIFKLIDEHKLQIKWPPDTKLNKKNLYEAFFSKVKISLKTDNEITKIEISSLASSAENKNSLDTYLNNLFFEGKDTELIAILNSSSNDAIKKIIFQKIQDYMVQNPNKIIDTLSTYSDFFTVESIKSYIETFVEAKLKSSDKKIQLHDFLIELMIKGRDDTVIDIIQHLNHLSLSENKNDTKSQIYKDVLQSVDNELKDIIYRDITKKFENIEAYVEHYPEQVLGVLDKIYQKVDFKNFDKVISQFLRKHNYRNPKVVKLFNDYFSNQTNNKKNSNIYFFVELPHITNVIQENQKSFPGITFSDG